MTLPSRRTRYALAAAWATAILIGSLVGTPGGTLPDLGPVGVVGADKWVHAAEYGVLATLVAWGALPRTRAAYLGLFVLVVGFGAVVELLQLPLATRTGAVADALANGLGAGGALLVWWGRDYTDRTAPDGDDARSVR